MFLRATAYDFPETYFLNMNEIVSVFEESRFNEMSVHMKDGNVHCIRAEAGWIHDALQAQSVYKRSEDEDLCNYGVQMQIVAIDPPDETQEERLKRIDNILEDFNFEQYPLSDFTANLKHLRNRFQRYIEEKY